MRIGKTVAQSYIRRESVVKKNTRKAVVYVGLDVHAEAGHDAALVRSILVQSPDGLIDVGFEAGAMGVGDAMVSGIEVLRVPQSCGSASCPADRIPNAVVHYDD